ncbi:acyl-CoA dehydrogenase family protein [Pseudomonas sp. PCH199]|uniref:acyl-CoA dehydrogenase family protein n=1 Tax=unclassified Pseudomonas TaxID=196821 RepID=UPI0015A7D158|nr:MULTISPECIES: acyl-CoA dehydrogenase family protein [unclassified Pseudomonas]MCW8279203.1 acyl-CoA dehydrogenase family protein [Pseudomonas sp. PCH199]
MTNAQLLSIDSMRTFVQREIEPLSSAMRYGAVSRNQLLELTQAVSEFGLPGMIIPKALGGHGGDWVTQGRLFEELAMGSVELAWQVLINIFASTLVLQQPALCERYLPDLIVGRSLFGITLNGSTSALHGRRKGAEWILDGRSDIVAANLHADVLICAVREHSQASSFLLLDRSVDRYEIRHYRDIEGRQQTCMQVTQACLPIERVLGDANADSPLTRHLFDVSKLHEAVVHLARGRSLLDASIARAKANTQFGRPIAAQHMVARQFAELATQLEAARLMCSQGFEQLDNGRLSGDTASRARLMAYETAKRIERRVSRIESHPSQTGWQHSDALLHLLSENIADDAQHIANALIGDLPGASDES